MGDRSIQGLGAPAAGNRDEFLKYADGVGPANAGITHGSVLGDPTDAETVVATPTASELSTAHGASAL